jgi:acyl-homoserine-lactone acylase
VGDGYLLDGQIIPFEKRTAIIKIKQNDGTFQEEKMEIKISKHGPVIGENGNKAYVVRIAGLDNFKIFEEYHKMAKAKNWKEFEAALKMLQMPMFNVIYADKNGNIFYLFNGNVPKRPEGDFAFWRGTIDGTKSKFIWHHTLAYKDLPKVLNPQTGFIQNCNDPPWTCTYPVILQPKKFLPFVAPLGMPLRPQRAVNLIKNYTSISFNELIGIKQNTGMEAADRFLDDLLIAVNKYPDTTAFKAAALLKAWDKKTDSDSKGAILFARWFDKLDKSMYAIPWSFEKPVTTPYGLKDEKKAVELLIIAANEIEKKYGALDVAFGDVYRFRMNGMDFPASGGFEQYGIFRSFSYKEDKNNKSYADLGETYVAITEFGKPVRAQVLLSYGNASQNGNRHIGDQLKLLSEKKLRQALLSRKDVFKNLEKKEVLF